jgi:hypothetical protein
MMVIQSFVNQVNTAEDNAITLFTSGQYKSVMVSEIMIETPVKYMV